MWKNNASQNGCSNLLASITRTPIRIAPRASAEGKSRLNRVFCSRLSFVALILQPYSSRLRSRQLFIPPLFPRIEIFFFFIQSLRGCNYPLTPDPVHLQSRFFFFFFSPQAVLNYHPQRGASQDFICIGRLQMWDQSACSSST